MDTKSVINRIIASYFEPYEIAIATSTNITSDLLDLCARDNWIHGVRSLIPEYYASVKAIISAINHKNIDMCKLLMQRRVCGFGGSGIIYAMASNDSPLLLTCQFWKFELHCIGNAIDGASSVNNTVLMQKIYDLAREYNIYYEPVTDHVVAAGHIKALQKLLDWNADMSNAFLEAIQHKQPECMQLIIDLGFIIINENFYAQHAIVHNNNACLILLYRHYNLDLYALFAYAVSCNDRQDAMRIIHNWGGSHNKLRNIHPGNLDLLAYLL